MEDFETILLSAIEEGKKQYGNAAGLAKASNTSSANISRWQSRKQSPRISEYASILGAVHAQLVFPGEQLATYEFIPCGLPYLDENGLLQMRERPHAPIALERHWLRNADIHPASSIMVEVADDSMSPLFSTGDLVLVDRADIDPRQGRIYLLSNAKGEIMFRRLKSEAGMGWTLLPENTAWSWAHETVPDITHIQIHGRVRWSSRMF